MNLIFFMLLSLIRLVIAIKNPNEKCEFKDTVDLTNQVRYKNGSYLYQNILIPEQKLASYDYRLEFLNKRQDADLHIRGCVCDSQKRRYCVKLCCDRGHFFDETKRRCEKLPQHRKTPTDLKIKFKNEHRPRNVNIFDHYVHQVGLPCANPEILPIDDDIWDLLEDGMLQIYIGNAQLDTVSYCLTPYRFNGSDEDVLMPMTCPIKNEATYPLLLNTYAMSASIVFLIPTILVYLLIKELRSNLRGKLLICYLFSMTVAYTVVSYINISKVKLGFTSCSIMGYTGYFFFMSAFMWLSVLCFDIWHNFREINADFNAKHNRIRFAFYSLYAWGSAGLLTCFAIWSQMSDLVEELYKPGIGIDICWLDTRKWSAALYFYLPNFIIIVFNTITFTHLTLRIYRVRSDLAKMTNREKSFQKNATVILRLFLIMGVSWIMDILSYCVRNFKDYEFLFILTDFCNAIQGVLIFILFVLKPNVIALIKTRFQPPKPARPGFNTASRETNFSRLTSSTAATGSTTIPVSP